MRALVSQISGSGSEAEAIAENDAGLLHLLERLLEDDADSVRSCLLPASTVCIEGAIREARGTVAEKTLRVEVEVLNRMMNLVGELVLMRNQMLKASAGVGGSSELARRLDCVTTGLRETVMQARMQPVSHVFGQLPRMVRDLARSCEKNVRLELSGQETGLDKSLLEAIKDPLTHALRNAVDHGIEAAGDRLAAGKPAHGTIRLSACHRNGWVVIELSDDGAGVSLERVRAKAVECGLTTRAKADEMSEREVLHLLFLPGFSTAGRVTQVSGRGVGMDVVKSNVERVGGRVEIESREGAGTVLRLRVPLTLAIVPALVVETCGEIFCLPQSSLAELVYVKRSEAPRLVEQIGAAQLFRLRESLLPIVSLDHLLGIEDTQRTRPEHGFYLAVFEVEGRRFGLALDRLLSSEEIVVKPLTSGLREIGLFSGATVLGNGGLVMILDVSTLAARAGAQPMRNVSKQHEKTMLADTAPRFVVYEGRVRGKLVERMAMPIDQVERIESVRLEDVEHVGGRMLLRRWGSVLELEDPSEILREMEREGSRSELTVLICTRPGRREELGLVVRRVLNIASGSEMPGHMALVEDRLLELHETHAPEMQWLEVA
jgi:two-component system chemotaxis sensor kinase CheA